MNFTWNLALVHEPGIAPAVVMMGNVLPFFEMFFSLLPLKSARLSY